MKFVCALTKVATFGIVNLQSDKLIIKDPITGSGNMLKQIKDTIFNDFNKGIWLGKRVSNNSNIGFSSYIFQNSNNNINLHYAVRVNGVNWNLEIKDGQSIIKRAEQKNSQFQWFYKGLTISSIQNLVEELNSNSKKLNFFLSKNIDVAKVLFLYARGVIQQADVYYMLFPKKEAEQILKDKLGYVPTKQVHLQIKNILLP